MKNLNSILEQNKRSIEFFNRKTIISDQPSTKVRNTEKRLSVLSIEIANIVRRDDLHRFRKLSDEEMKLKWGIIKT